MAAKSDELIIYATIAMQGISRLFGSDKLNPVNRNLRIGQSDIKRQYLAIKQLLDK